MTKRLLSIIVAFLVLQALSATVKAAADARITFTQDCNSVAKLVQIGFQSNPDDPANGPEIIAVRLTLSLTPGGATTVDDLKNASLQINSNVSSAVSAEQSTSVVGNAVETKIMVAFSTGPGLSQSRDMVLIKGVDNKAYQVSLKSAELYPKNSTSNIYKGGSTSFSADPASCVSSSTSATSTSTVVTAISLTSDKPTAKPGDAVMVTAVIQNRNGGNIDWTQKAGGSMQPQISNQDQADGSTKSTLVFAMPSSGDDVKLEVKVGASVQSLTIAIDKPAQLSTDASSPSDTLEERLRKRREAQQNDSASVDLVGPSDAAPGDSTTSNIHQAAGQTDLAGSGPGETALIAALGAILLLAVWKRISKKC